MPTAHPRQLLDNLPTSVYGAMLRTTVPQLWLQSSHYRVFSTVTPRDGCIEALFIHP
jgi:hypothetical protein